MFRFRLLWLIALLVLSLAFAYGKFFGPVEHTPETRTVLVTPEDTLSTLAARLKFTGLIRSEWAFEVAYVQETGSLQLRPGGYELSPSYDAWRTSDILGNAPYLAWVRIPRGRRVEEVADILAEKLAWRDEQKLAFLTEVASWPAAYQEGVFFPDTYLIPSEQEPAQVALSIRTRFQEAFKPLEEEAARQGIKWTTVVKIASLLEREAAGAHDMPLIAGIIWKRLDRDMKLQIDATLQYIKGNREDGWWGTVKSEDKYLESEFNTYQYTGLPPAPIASPGLDSLNAVLYPETTTCLFYLHDYDGDIHCSANYAGHLANIRRYLQ